MATAENQASRRTLDAGSAMRRARTLTCDLIEQESARNGRILPCPPVHFDLRGQSAGQLRIDRAGHCAIRYNLALLERYPEDFLSETVPHEVAHYLAYMYHGRGIKPHGPEWRGIMRALGARPERCHAYDTRDLETRRLRRHVYHCGCGDHLLTSIRHKRVARGTRYLCRRCGEALRPGASDGTRDASGHG